MKKQSIAIALVILALWCPQTARSQSNPCVASNAVVTNFDWFVAGGVFPQIGCVGEPFTISGYVFPAGSIELTTFEDCSQSPYYSTNLVSPCWVILDETVPGAEASSNYFAYSTNFDGTNIIIVPESCGTGTIVFGWWNGVCWTNNFTAVGVESLAPTNNGLWTNFASSDTNIQIYLIPVQTNAADTNLPIYATSCPALNATNLPNCWSLNGIWTNVVNLDVSQPALYTNICSAGTSAITNFVVVTNFVTNGNGLAPIIVEQPFSQTVDDGNPASFSVVVTGTAPFGYQWAFDGAEIVGATADTYTITNVEPSDVGTYSVVVTNAAGSIMSSNAILTDNSVPPMIVTQSGNGTAANGGNFTFFVDAAGTAPLNYQWSFDGTNIGGATNSSYEVTNVQSADCGSYVVVVTNYTGSVTSTVATLSTPPVLPPSILAQPASQSIETGSTAVLSVWASGAPPLSYQWYFNWVQISGATNTYYIIPNVQASNTGTYFVTVTNSVGAANSTYATLSTFVSAAFVATSWGDTNAAYSTNGVDWTASPQGLPGWGYWLALTYGRGMFVTVADYDTQAAYSFDGINWNASPGMPVWDQWSAIAYGNGMFVAVAENDTNAAYSLDGINWHASPGGMPTADYWDAVTYGNGMFVAVTADYGGGTNAAYSTNGIDWTASPGGLPSAEYWDAVAYGNGIFVAIANGRFPDFTNKTAYSTNGIDWYASPGGLLYSSDWISLTYGNGTFVAISDLTTNVAYSANGIDWTASPTGLPTSTSYSVTYGSDMYVAIALNNTNAAYSLDGSTWTSSPGGLPAVSDWWVSVAAGYSNPDESGAPYITLQPVSQTVNDGGNANFRVSAIGQPPLTYQWLIDGADISGATNALINISEVTSNNMGVYSVVVSNLLGSTVSSNVLLNDLAYPNLIPNGWELAYFGTTNLSTNGDYDNSGYSLLYDYQNGIDPNVILFALSATNNYFNTTNASLLISVSAGIPAYVAVLVDTTNFSAATWMPYNSSNILANLGPTQGWHNVWVGLRGLPSNATQTWQSKRLNLALTPPQLVVTSPNSNIVSVPMIQLQGYSPEALASITYDLSNAATVVRCQQVLIVDQFYDTNISAFTTNIFQAFDVPLTNGMNTFTLHATDLAGNVTTTNFSFTLDYSGQTNPPAIQLIWPQDGMTASGTNFIVSGWVSDPTATVTAQTVGTNGLTNTFTASIGRDGQFYFQNAPLAAGTNVFTLTVTDAAGNVTTTNLTVVQGNLGLSVDPIVTNQTMVTGEIASSGYTVWVNGVKATNNNNGTWSAYNVPIPANSSLVQVTAIPNTDNGGNGSGDGGSGVNPVSAQSLNSAVVASNSGVFLSYFTGSYIYNISDADGHWDNLNQAWNFTNGGSMQFINIWSGYDGNEGDQLYIYTSVPNSWPQQLPSECTYTTAVNGITNVDYGYPFSFGGFPIEHSEANLTKTYPSVPPKDVPGEVTCSQITQTKMCLATGGPLGSTNQRLWMVSVNANADTLTLPPYNQYGDADTLPSYDQHGYTMSLPYDYWGYADPWAAAPVSYALGPIPYDQLTAGVFGQLDTNGNAYAMLPDNTTLDATVYAPGNDYYDYSIAATPVLDQASIILSVVSGGATIISTNNDWAMVLGTTDHVVIQASCPGSPDAINSIKWNIGDATHSNNFFWTQYWPTQDYLPISTNSPQEYTVTATVPSKFGVKPGSLNLWVIWADLTINVGGILDSNDHAFLLVSNNLVSYNWPTPTNFHVPMSGDNNGLGGGVELGPTDCTINSDLNYAYTIGKMEAKAVLYPTGIGNILTNEWKLKRTVISIAWDNAGAPSLSNGPPGSDDTSDTRCQSLNPISGAIFDLDAPGCSVTLPGTLIDHTAEYYGNFYEYVTVNLNGPQVCSDTKTWNYRAQVDLTGIPIVQLNSLTTGTNDLPTKSIYYPEQ